MGFIYKGLVGILNLVYDQAEKEYLDEEPYKEILRELYSSLEAGEITEEEYEKDEEEVLDRLREIREYKREQLEVDEEDE